MTHGSTSREIECEHCGHEYEVEFCVWAPDRSVGDNGGAELDGDPHCPKCGGEPSDQRIAELCDEINDGYWEGEELAYGDRQRDLREDR